MDGQTSIFDVLEPAKPKLKYRYYRDPDPRFTMSCPCGFCGKRVTGWHPEGWFINGFQGSVCQGCINTPKPPREEWELQT